VTIIDDATLPGLLGSLNVDDEGTPGGKTLLVGERRSAELHARQDFGAVL